MKNGTFSFERLWDAPKGLSFRERAMLATTGAPGTWTWDSAFDAILNALAATDSTDSNGSPAIEIAVTLKELLGRVPDNDDLLRVATRLTTPFFEEWPACPVYTSDAALGCFLAILEVGWDFNMNHHRANLTVEERETAFRLQRNALTDLQLKLLQSQIDLPLKHRGRVTPSAQKVDSAITKYNQDYVNRVLDRWLDTPKTSWLDRPRASHVLHQLGTYAEALKAELDLEETPPYHGIVRMLVARAGKKLLKEQQSAALPLVVNALRMAAVSEPAPEG